MNKSYLILTDSGGFKKSPSLGKPAYNERQYRETGRRQSRNYKVIGTDEIDIFNTNLVMNKNEYNKMSSKANPFGDGKHQKEYRLLLKIMLKK